MIRLTIKEGRSKERQKKDKDDDIDDGGDGGDESNGATRNHRRLIAVTSRKYIKTGCWTDFLSQTYTSLLSSFPDITSMNIPRLLFLSISLCSSQRRRAKCINFISPPYSLILFALFFFF